MATIQIRDISEEDAEIFRRRAAAAGMSLQAYMHQQLHQLAQQRTKAEIMAVVRAKLEADPGPGASVEDILDDLHALRDE